MKTKVRFDGLDVAAMVAQWNRVALGRRVINIYDGPNGDTYLFKLDKSSNAQTNTAQGDNNNSNNNNGNSSNNNNNNNNNNQSSNLILLMESGIRFHSTRQPVDTPGMPSPFCSKLRKHLRGLRLEQVQQLGNYDRVVHLVFGSGDQQRHSLLLELYSKGNIILTNASFTILSLLRSHEYEDKSGGGGGGDNATAAAGAGDSDTVNNNKNNKNGSQQVKVKVGHAYPVTYATTMNAIQSETGEESKEADVTTTTFLDAPNPMEWYQAYSEDQQKKEQEQEQQPQTNNNNNGGKGKKNKKKNKGGAGNGHDWKQLLSKSVSGVSHYGPSLIDHCLLWLASLHQIGDHNSQTEGNKPKQPSELNEEEWKLVQSVLKEKGDEVLNSLNGVDSKGYIFYKPKDKNKNDSNAADDSSTNKAAASPNAPTSSFDGKLILEFQPHILKQHQPDASTTTMKHMEYDSFDQAVDAFFSHIEGQKRMMGAERQQAQAQQKLERIRQDQKQRVQALEMQQESLKEQAQLVEFHADMVEKAIQVVNSALDSGMDWDQLEDLVQIEKVQNQNPVAMLIHKLQLEQDAMVLRLAREGVMYEAAGDDDDDDGNDDQKDAKTLDVTVSLKETAHANASALFAKYRASKEKSQKTIEASAKALEAAEENAQRQLLEAQTRKKTLSHNMAVKRKPLWFEKFNWFITSDNYLVIGGRDAQQNEQIVKRYLRPGDAYLHADVHGAASCVLRAKRKRQTNGKTTPLSLSDQALREAGNFTICRSSAWSSRMVTSAWWVESHQVSKTAPSGEYLTVGSFMIRGKKTFLPPTQLEMGLGVLFRLGDDDAIARHKNERRDFALMQMDDQDDLDLEIPLSTEKPVQAPTAKQEAVKKEPPAFVEEKKTEKPDDGVNDEVDTVSPPMATAAVDEANKSEDSGKEEPVSDDEEKERDEDATETQEPAPTTAPPQQAKPKKGLSVKERKLIRKYGSLEAAKAAEEEREKAQAAKKAAATTPAEQKAKTNGQTEHKRGKKAKLKRMAKKYADQDEEDRELAMLALHAGEKIKSNDQKKAPEINETEKEAAAQTVAILKKDSYSIAQKLPEEVQGYLSKCVTVTNGDETTVRWDKFDGDVLEQLESFDLLEEKVAAAQRLLNLKESTRIDNFSASLAGIIRTIKKYGHEGLGKQEVSDDGKRKTKAEKEAESKSWKQTLAEEGIVEDESEEDVVDDTVELNKLTGKPHPDDLILFAVPVCAPYQTLSKYGYRVKLTPGNMKRGRASKQCIDVFLKEGQESAVVDRSKDLIRKVGDSEWVSAICGDVKISAAGASKAMKNQKMKNKGKGKK
ncbi:unnamed protein product [Cylindrotheca closterium]|uniref:NFACT RNA-binding domain-containing protein n=1 Tax=Cylindrotheca closterium TaxID=2856 RepID=A0AAD2FLN3_9STRA|nr:unnamed protein product [Cylindrotheca closterium]